MNAAVLFIVFAVFAAPVAAGAVWGGWCWGRDRIRMRRAFARGRAESTVRVPQPVEPLPTFAAVEVVT